MTHSKFTESQIIFAIKQSESGVRVSEVCRKMGISEGTFYTIYILNFPRRKMMDFVPVLSLPKHSDEI